MFSETNPAPTKKSAFKNPSLYTSVLVVIVVFVVAWTLFSRWRENRAYDQRQKQEQLERQHKADEAAIEQLGGNDLAIQMFYVSPATIQRGETAQLCYGVANAKTIAIQPSAGDVWPSHSRCLDVTPHKTTTYELSITGASGAKQNQSVTLTVR